MLNDVICFHVKALSAPIGTVKPISPPPVIDLESFAYKPLKKDPVPVNTRRSKVSHQLPLFPILHNFAIVHFPSLWFYFILLGKLVKANRVAEQFRTYKQR